jgi:maltose alpha-D-glucosyltransferase/alpha-amylase
MAMLHSRLADVPPDVQPEAEVVLSQEMEIARRFDVLLERPIHALRTRIHGDYHLGQVLYTGADFMIIDFEGEPARPLSERRQKGSPLQDVAGMLRSFHYAAYAAYFYIIDRPDRSERSAADLETWARYWHLWVSVAYLQTYLQVADGAPFIPADRKELKALLDAYLLSKAVYELGYELNNRPHWVAIPLQGILQTAQAVQD